MLSARAGKRDIPSLRVFLFVPCVVLIICAFGLQQRAVVDGRGNFLFEINIKLIR